MVARETRSFKSGGQALTGLNWSRRTSLVRQQLQNTTSETTRLNWSRRTSLVRQLGCVVNIEEGDWSQLVPKDLIGETAADHKYAGNGCAVSIGPEGPHW